MKKKLSCRPACWLALLGCLTAGPALAQEPAPAAGQEPERPIPVLCYHRFGHYPPQDEFFVTPDEFARQLDIISQEGFTPILASELEAGLSGNKPLPPWPVLITIDDGYADVWKRARPLLKARGFKATLFIYPAYIGARHGLTRDQLLALHAEGYEIGSHSLTHPKLTKRLAGETQAAYAARLQRELAGSRETLQQWLGAAVDSLAYPYGLWDQTVAAAAVAAGYKLMFTVNPGTNVPRTSREQLKRIIVVHGMKDQTFRALLHEVPLALSSRSLEPGARVAGPVNTLTFRLAPEARTRIKPASLAVKKGACVLELRYDRSTGEAECRLPEPWVQGTDVLVATAADLSGSTHFKESWLVTVEPPAPKEEK